jgi:hypothetical protein
MEIFKQLVELPVFQRSLVAEFYGGLKVMFRGLVVSHFEVL